MTTRGHHGLMMGAATGPTDAYFGSVASLLHFDGANHSTTIADQKGKTWTPFGNVEIETTSPKYGAASSLFDGNGDYATTPSHADFDFGSGDFTVETWVKFNDLTSSANQPLVVRDQIGGTRGWLLYNSNSADSTPRRLTFAAWVGGTVYAVADTVSQTTGTWRHVAAVRDGGTLRLYKGGVQVGSTSISGSVGAPSEPCAIGTLWGIGAPQGSGNYLNGRLDDMRITKGVCRYPSGTTFTPPTAAFPDA